MQKQQSTTKKIFSLIAITLLIASMMAIYNVEAQETTFGNTDARESSNLGIEGKIAGTNFTYSGDSMQGAKMFFYIDNWIAGNVTGLIYDQTENNSLIGKTNQFYVTANSGLFYWYNTTFSTTPVFENGHVYILAGWSDSGDMKIGCSWVENKSAAQTIAYNYTSPPDPLIEDSGDPYGDASIYVTLEEVAEPTPTPTPPLSGDDNILCLGDSITQGLGKDPDYPKYLGILTDSNTTNAGINGATSTDLYQDWNESYRTGNFTYLITLMGVNDIYSGASVATIQANLQAIWLDAIENQSSTVIAITVLPSSGYTTGYLGAWNSTMQAKTLELNQWILNADSINANIHPLNLYSPMDNATNTGYLKTTFDSGDGIHPNQNGTNYIALSVYNFMIEIENPPTPTPTPTATPTATTAPITPGTITTALTEVFFGELWVFGLMLWLIVALVILRLWAYSTVFLVPISILFEFKYYQYYSSNSEMVWGMILLGFFTMAIAAYSLSKLSSKRGNDD